MIINGYKNLSQYFFNNYIQLYAFIHYVFLVKILI